MKMLRLALRILLVVFGLFVSGMLLATAKNDVIVSPFLSMHALWHLVSAFAFVFLWAFNHTVVEARRETATPALGRAMPAGAA